MFSSDKTSQLCPGRLGSYRRTARLRKQKEKQKTRKSDAESPSQLEKRLKKIVVTREVYTRSEHSLETPRKFLGGVRLHRSATRLSAPAASLPSPLPPSSRASTIPQSPIVTIMDGLQFREDPRFRPWQKSLLAGGGRDNTCIGAFENDIGDQERVSPYEAVSQELEPIFHSSKSSGEGGSPAPPEIRRSSADSNSDDYERLSCGPLQLQTAGIGRSTGLLKARIAQKVSLGKSLKTWHRSSIRGDLAQIQEPGRVAIPRQITIGRRLRSQKKSENLRVSSGTKEETTQSHATLRLVNANVEEPQSISASRDPELTAMLHDPNQNRFSDSWEKFYEEQTQGMVAEDEQLFTDVFVQSDVAPPLKVSSPSAVNSFFANGAAIIARHEGHLQQPTAGRIETQIRTAPPIIRIKESTNEALRLIAPSPGPRTSSKGGIFSKFMGPGKVPPPVSPSIIRARPSNISKPRKASDRSVLTDYENGMNPVHSTDTLAKIEVELHSSPSRPALANIANVSTRTKNLSIDSGPSGSAPDRELPQLPEDCASAKSRSKGSSRNRHVRKQSGISIGHAQNNLSAPSISTVQAISPSKHGSAGSHTLDHAWRINPGAPQRAIYGQIFDQVPFDHSTTRRSEALHPGNPAYSQENALPASTEAFLRKQAQKAARAESRRIIKQRDMASNGPIEEENESDTVFPLTQPVDPIDQFPDPPCSRSGSRASTRRARSIQRSQSTARRFPPRGIANQILSASRIVTIENDGLATPNRRNNHRSPSTKSRPSDSPLRDGAGTPIQQKVKSSLPKKIGQRSIRSHTSQSALAPKGAHTPPSSDSCNSDDELALGGLRRLDLRREIQEIRALMILQGRTIDKLQNTVRLYMPTSRSRSRDLSLDRDCQRQLQQQLQVMPPSFCYSRRAIAETESGTVMIGDVVVEPVGNGRGFGGVRIDVEERRLSHAPLTERVDAMVDQQFRRLG
jgi:hypothetical protein